MAVSLNTTGSNERIGVGVIGFGAMCASPPYLPILKELEQKSNIRLAGCSDLLPARFTYRSNFNPRVFRSAEVPFVPDYHQLLEHPDVDAIVVATHDSMHAEVCMAALNAGKHVYCDAPMTRYLPEAFKLHDRVRSTNKVFQCSVAGCSAEGWSKCGELVRQGAIGTLTRCEASYCRNSMGGEWNYPMGRETALDDAGWERWLGPVTKRPFNAEHLYRWRKYYAFSVGPLGHLGSWRLFPLLKATGKPEFPIRVNCVSSHLVDADSPGGFPRRTVPGHVFVQAEFPSGYVLALTCGTVCVQRSLCSIHGHNGTIEMGFSGQNLTVIPEPALGKKAATEDFQKFNPEDQNAHLQNWFNCIRSGDTPTADIDLALKVQTIISLAEMSDRLKLTCLFDPLTRQVTDGSGKRKQLLTYGTLD